MIAFLFLSLFAAFPLTKGQSEESLAVQFAPVLRFTSGEKFYPTSVDYVVSSSTLMQRGTAGIFSSIVSSDLSPSNLGSFTGEDLYLDNNFGSLENIAADYASTVSSLGYYTYVHVTNSGSQTVIQYWFLYVFNNGPLNEHQGDWEVIEIFFDNSGDPERAIYSQHGAGENAAWGDIEKQNNHPIVYVAQGSHANYFRSYQGKMGIENDIVAADGKTIQPDELNIVILGEPGSQPADQSWLNFAGRWGYWGNEQEVALGMAGPLGPVYNQDGIRWSEPENYLASTLTVDGTYFIIALLVANFLLIFLVYTAIRGAWKAWGIAKLKRKGGLLIGKIIRGRVVIGVLIGIAAVGISIAAFFLPWYSMTAVSQAGPLSQQSENTLMTINGVNGLQVNLFLGAGSADSTSGFTSIASAQMPFAIIIAAGVILLFLDIIGVKNKNKLANKFIFGIVGMLLPIIFIIVIVMLLPSLLPLASGILPGQSIPGQIENLINTVGSNPIGGTQTTTFPIIGVTTVNWGLSIGAYLFIVAAILRIIGGIIIRTAPETQPYQDLPPPPPPPPI